MIGGPPFRGAEAGTLDPHEGTAMKHWRGLAFVGLMLGLGLAVAGCGGGSRRLQGAGSTFVEPMMQDWVAEYKNQKGTEVNYQGTGSSAGISKMTAKEVDFGCSDAPLNDEQMTKAREQGGDVLHIPLVLG